MPPKFSLQSVLDYRHTRVEALEIELSELLTALNKGKDLMEKLENQLNNLYQQLTDQQIGDIDLVAINVMRTHIKTLQSQIKQVLEGIAILEENITLKRNELIVAKQDEEALTVLKNKEIERYNSEMNIREQRQQDEIYIAQAFRKRGQE